MVCHCLGCMQGSSPSAWTLNFPDSFQLFLSLGTLWVISNWLAWMGMELTPTSTFRCEFIVQDNVIWFLPVSQRISSMAVENLPVFNSVSKDKLMNIATQVGLIWILQTLSTFSLFPETHLFSNHLCRCQTGQTTRRTTEQKQCMPIFWDFWPGPAISSFLCWLCLISAFVDK